MVYLREIIQRAQANLAETNSIEYVAYLFLRHPSRLSGNFELTPEEELALKGYRNETVEAHLIKVVAEKKPIKGVNALLNVYKLAGLYLASKGILSQDLKTKFANSDLRQKYFLYLIEPDLKTDIVQAISCAELSNDNNIIRKILFPESETEIDAALQLFIQIDIGVQELLILEDLEKALLKIKYISKGAEELVMDILHSFGNAVKKVVTQRRKDHPEFKITDEYDVQDMLYVVIKSVFPNLRAEDPIPKVGAKSTKIDLILREERILIEVKMLKEKDTNETEFIEQLKIDFESYHECQWLQHLYCYVYDPFSKTKDANNFKSLAGERVKNGHIYDVEIILGS